jgi:ribulose-phosphate 3-epimerase
MDGHFVPNITFGPALVRAVRRRTKLPLDIHLMIEDPAKFVGVFAESGGDTLVFHAEAAADPKALVETIHGLGRKAGIGVRPGSPLSMVAPVVSVVDQVLIMSVEPGFSGQKFIPEVLPKVSEARQQLTKIGSDADISIDGGVTVTTAQAAAAAGATFFVCGNSVYSEGSVPENLQRIRRSVEEGARREVR